METNVWRTIMPRWKLFFALLLLSATYPAHAKAAEKTFYDLTEQQMSAVFKELQEKWHPTHVKGYAKGTESRYDVTWQSGNPGFYLYFGVSSDKLAKFREEHAREGYRVTVESTWRIDGRDFHAAIFRKK